MNFKFVLKYPKIITFKTGVIKGVGPILKNGLTRPFSSKL